ncbi:CopG family transcriptional regulator [Streptomyces pini]|uniref:CopG family transcriptional regulator n=1 Tax=Streptomyces pini TaxID=1520580 RepID=A0A1I4A0J9_9ACTN|nr:CopG family transcriptional regulator [Streptomyces pini]SFK49740.1 hypothetical protein SAMN05192584_106246 [Streptomyces pini]
MIPEDLLEELRPKAAERGLSAYFTEALRLKREQDREQGRFRKLVDWLEDEHGPVTEGERAAALRELEDLDTEHDRRRTTARNHPGEAARG